MLAIALLGFIFILNWTLEFVGIKYPLEFVYLLAFAGKWCTIIAIALIVGWCFGD
ncbi:MAG: hypothetical protein J7647_31575 [Cyanobacteria bacterium SBLK]|nr:hypothetical protein [Cyanobacteria bacterium SBLK]